MLASEMILNYTHALFSSRSLIQSSEDAYPNVECTKPNPHRVPTLLQILFQPFLLLGHSLQRCTLLSRLLEEYKSDPNPE